MSPPKRTRRPSLATSAAPPQVPLQPEAIVKLLSVSANLPPLEVSRKWDRTTGPPSLSTLFFGVHLCCGVRRYFLPLSFLSQILTFVLHRWPNQPCRPSYSPAPIKITGTSVGRWWRGPLEAQTLFTAYIYSKERPDAS